MNLITNEQACKRTPCTIGTTGDLQELQEQQNAVLVKSFAMYLSGERTVSSKFVIGEMPHVGLKGNSAKKDFQGVGKTSLPEVHPRPKYIGWWWISMIPHLIINLASGLLFPLQCWCDSSVEGCNIGESSEVGEEVEIGDSTKVEEVIKADGCKTGIESGALRQKTGIDDVKNINSRASMTIIDILIRDYRRRSGTLIRNQHNVAW
ncbi:hypothetical protein CPB83DRAFT_840605 [Crepidotus variabilis]|uniref:Uncharacterized protein n=1 Tax=Crepidotus variabilis TaxID=179855 RepID=A0A9P6E485_9AGAR|nr:hypothetical protein CPB83DRAFT_840605 [Crepidotus variabilis]